jgi:hypothetical protein
MPSSGQKIKMPNRAQQKMGRKRGEKRKGNYLEVNIKQDTNKEKSRKIHTKTELQNPIETRTYCSELKTKVT